MRTRGKKTEFFVDLINGSPRPFSPWLPLSMLDYLRESDLLDNYVGCKKVRQRLTNAVLLTLARHFSHNSRNRIWMFCGGILAFKSTKPSWWVGDAPCWVANRFRRTVTMFAFTNLSILNIEFRSSCLISLSPKFRAARHIIWWTLKGPQWGQKVWNVQIKGLSVH